MRQDQPQDCRTGTALVIGASGGIARAVTRALRHSGSNVVTVSRRELPEGSAGDRHFVCDHSEVAIEQTCQALRDWRGQFTRVVICNGVLHSRQVQPEKRLEDLHYEALEHSIRVNALVPALWVSRLLPVLKGEQRCVLGACSARVGSIADNHRGGWYGYRSSKAALNMLLKTAAIEYARRAPLVKLLTFQPGTTDTPLSRPFQRGVPESQLFTPDFVAERLLAVMDSVEFDGDLSFLDWSGEVVPW